MLCDALSIATIILALHLLVHASMDVKAVAKQYIAWDTNAHTRSVIQGLLDSGDTAGLTKALGSRLEFGTAGLRGPMAAGYTAMNELVVMQTTQGLAKYLEDTFGTDAAHSAGVALGWDHRAAEGGLSSEKFALLAAEVLLRRGFRVVLLPGLVHTPLVPYAVQNKGCKAGVMVTASHNPKEDDGYKVYWDNGAQIIPPHDAGISKCIDANLEPWAKYACHTTAPALLGAHSDLATDCTSELSDQYFRTMASELCRFEAANRKSEVKVVYTAMHGVGAPWFAKAFEAFGLPPPIPVAEQQAPDPTFPTVAFPNPEEGAGALELAFATAERNGASLVLANDPDADRLAVAERVNKGVTGAAGWRVLSGNEIGILLADWEWSQYKARRDGKGGSGGGGKKRAKPKPAAMLSSAVSSHMLKALAAHEGFHWEETLTGFKWLCSRACELRAEGYEVLMCFEEAIGYCLGGLVHDKDGVSAGAVFAEMAGYLQRTHGRTIVGQLEHLADKLGHFSQNNGYIVCRQPKTTAAIFDRLRADGHYWLLLDGVPITGVRDLTTGVDTAADDGKATLPLSSSSHMITYTFANGATATVRGSGTEPKIKWYAEMCSTDKLASETAVAKLVEAIIEQMLQPEKNGLERRK